MSMVNCRSVHAVEGRSKRGYGEDRTGSGYDVVVQLRQGNIDDLRSGSLLAGELKEHE